MKVPVHIAACPAATTQTLVLSGEEVSATMSEALDRYPQKTRRRDMMILRNMAKIQSGDQDLQFVKFNIFIVLTYHLKY
jgi:hypothetical protein